MYVILGCHFIMILYLSPKGKVLLLSGIMAAFGIGVSIVIIAVHGGFSGPCFGGRLLLSS
jgi:hypothetical protein